MDLVKSVEKWFSSWSVETSLLFLQQTLLGLTAVMAGLLASRIPATLLGPIPVKLSSSPRHLQVVTGTSKPFSSFESTLDHNLFQVELGGLKKLSDQQETPVLGDLAAQVAKLSLLGVYQGREKLAMLLDQGTHEQGVFATGELVFSGPGLIKEIKGDLDQAQVLLAQGEKEIWLDLSNSSAATPPPKEGSYAKQRALGETQAISSTSKNGKDFFLSSEEVDAQLNNLPTLLNQARVIPYFKDGKNEGYIIKAIDKGSLYEKLGLQNNDVIQKINGETIDSPEKAFSLLKMLRTERNISLSLKRNDTPRTLSYHIN